MNWNESEEVWDFMQDPSVSNRVEAAAMLLESGKKHPEAIETLAGALADPRVEAKLHAMRAIELLGDRASDLEKSVKSILNEARNRQDENPCWMFVVFSAEAWLERR